MYVSVNIYVSTTTFWSGKNLILRNDLDLECGCDTFYSAAMINNSLLLLALTSALLRRPNIDKVSAVLSSWQLHAVNADTSAKLTHLPKSTWPTRTVLDADCKTIKAYYSPECLKRRLPEILHSQENHKWTVVCLIIHMADFLIDQYIFPVQSIALISYVIDILRLWYDCVWYKKQRN